MKHILKSIFMIEDSGFENFVPEIPHNFQILVFLTIGPEGMAGGSDYTISVCTPTWLDHCIQNEGPLSGRHYLIVNRFDAAEIRAHIEKTISQSERESLEESQAVLARFFAWEFEDYQP